MNTLAFDTASPRVAAAIVRADGERVERGIVTDGPRHVEELIPLIEELLTEMSVVGAEIDRVVVGVGPGQFNGLRVGVTTANMLARVEVRTRWRFDARSARVASPFRIRRGGLAVGCAPPRRILLAICIPPVEPAASRVHVRHR